MFKKILLAAVVASSLGSVAAPTFAQDFGYRNAPPPPPREEVMPAPRRGYAWVPGYWQFRNHRYVWVAGTWVRERRGQHFVPAHWEQRGNRWFFVQGSWQRGYADRDHDGVPNRFDRRPNNPNRY